MSPLPHPIPSAASRGQQLAMPPMHAHRYITTLNDPYKQGQYSNVLKTLQEERRHLQDIELALYEFKKAPAAASSRPSQVSDVL